ncbi:MAG: glycosyl hydrolase 115 family protein [Pontiellaceae bacterium]|nr:glycosyl hydrolase 115 family protein [Pontiellaceae bacterium]MBN2784821.1 glycosyl hydrolase 115 family protein [Pontiellaceae bacterium]
MRRFFSVWSVVFILASGGMPALAGLGLAVDFISDRAESGGDFPLVADGIAAELWHDADDHAGVIRAIGDLRMDIERVTDRKPHLSTAKTGCRRPVIIGTLGRSSLIDALVSNGKLNDSDLKGKWESFVIATVANPAPGIREALVIAGSDKRGTIYGIYELSEQLGVSPWYWWADVHPKKRKDAYVMAGRYASGEPVVKYRGIFINDEEPCFGPWAREKFGGINSKMYAHMFELILRMRGNYLWPAMWGKAFNEDDPLNPRLADEYGIVMGTSHHEPMIRAQQEWHNHRSELGNGEWNYYTNEDGLKKFWTDGIIRNRAYESIVTIGMRGDGDEEMIKGGNMDDNVRLLERIVSDQRAILKAYINPDVTQVPQLWALYKEVMEYYEHGMRVPDDVTLLWCDDNWGNIRRLPTPEERRRSGGAGVYYHFDYVGGPRCYKWLNTNPLPKVWEQMNLAYEYDATRIWIVNVGDLKPMELPIEFFLRMAWNPAALQKEKIADFTRQWAAREFGVNQSEEIADIVSKYLKYAGWRKPELIDPDTFSLINYREAERVSDAWGELVARAESVHENLPDEQKDACFQLVLHPVKAASILVDMYIAAGRNHLYAEQGRAAANTEAARVRALFEQDQLLTDYFHAELADGKWNHMMSQTHVGYTGWRDPERNVMPDIKDVDVSGAAAFGVAVEGSRPAWPGSPEPAMLPVFDSLNNQRSYIDVFQRSSRPAPFTVQSGTSWIVLDPQQFPDSDDSRFWVSIDWEKVPTGPTEGEVRIVGRDETVAVKVVATKADKAAVEAASGCFGGMAGPVVIAPELAVKNRSVNGVCWSPIPDYGRYAAGMTVFPTTAESILPPHKAPSLEYPVYIAEAGSVDVDLIIGPTLHFVPGRGLRIAVSFDDEHPQLLDAFPAIPESYNRWANAVSDNARVLHASCEIKKAGRHMLKISMVDPGVVLQRIVLHRGPVAETYLGPPAHPVSE